MLDAYEATLGWRLAGAGICFAALLGYDLLRFGWKAPRLREYSFLLFTLSLAVSYTIAHDHITATISPEYFLQAKGLAADPLPFRWAVTSLAIRVSYGIELLSGALLLMANNPSPHQRQLPYQQLMRYSLIPLGSASLLAGLVPFVFRSIASLRVTAVEMVGTTAATRFLTTWGMHAGSYLGGILGVMAVIILVRRQRHITSDLSTMPQPESPHA